jgi:putative membrane-bound dehydrogenase-like protein
VKPSSACAFILALFAGAAWAGTPIRKSGPCPPFTRHAASPADNWTQFPTKPVPKDSFPVGTIQDPLTPAQSINCIETTPGLKAELWASEEMPGGITYVQDFDFDERGRLWAVEPKSYPNIIRPSSGGITGQKFSGGQDRILILEDTDGDHVMDKAKVFRDGLNLPQSIAVVNGGVVVAMQPYLVFFPNHDDTAGTPEILFQGMGSSNDSAFDTQGGINSLMYGLDNWIYGHTGYNYCTATAPGIPAVNCGQGRVWRFRHTSLGHAATQFQVWSTGPSNAHGIGQMEDGQIFQSGATGTAHINHSAEQGANTLDIRTVNPAFTAGANPKNVFYPITGDRFLWEGSVGKNADGWFTSMSTAASGLQFYTSRLFPQRYWGRYAFVCEGASKLCNQDSLAESGADGIIGSSWKAYRLPGPEHANLLASKDAWVAPILAKTGPDGAVWVLDWNNYNTLHNPASPLGMGGAWMNELRVKHTNRIYRLLPDSAAPEPRLDLSHATEDELIAAFANPNFFWRLTAQRLLIAKGYKASLKAKLKAILVSDRTADETGNSPRAQHALWTLDGLGQFAQDTSWNAILADLLRHPAWGVRRNVLRVMPRNAASAAAIGHACAVNDPHGHVRLQALLALAESRAVHDPRAPHSDPAGQPAIWKTYRDIDNLAKAAADSAGIDSAETKPCSPELYPAEVPSQIGPKGPAGPGRAGGGRALRFQGLPGGFRLLADAELPAGTLSIYDTRGRQAFASRYEPAKSAWSPGAALGLADPVYVYVFRGSDGSVRKGRIAPLGFR